MKLEMIAMSAGQFVDLTYFLIRLEIGAAVRKHTGSSLT
jgi:hypothetical protein